MALILSRYEIGSSESKFSSIERFEIETRERERETGGERDSRNSQPILSILTPSFYLESEGFAKSIYWKV